jgi:hypothetical protein
MTMRGLFAVVLAGTVLGGPVTRALADTFSPVDFSSQANWTWSGTESPGHGQPSGVYLPGAPTGQTSLGGVPFDITSNAAGDQAWSGFIANTGSGSASITINVNTYGVTNVYTLINTIWGEDGGPYAALIFTGSGGETYTKYLYSDVDMRDYNLYNTVNINGTTTTNVFSVYPDIFYRQGALDMQDITLPAAFATDTLATIQLVDNGNLNVQRVILDGVTVESVPEPSTRALLTAGAIALVGYGWRRRRATRIAKPAAFDQQEAPAILPFTSHSSPAHVARSAA